jgi:hypothetical protein
MPPIPGFHVLPIYGGQSYGPQLSALRRGVHVVVGTPGRVIDHLDKGSLDLSKLKTLVLDEADEMLRMGFIDDVERILQETPADAPDRAVLGHDAVGHPPHRQHLPARPGRSHGRRQDRHAENIRQRYWLVSGMHKLDALTRILEAENVRRHDHLQPHQDRHRRAGGTPAGARLLGRRHQRRHAAGRRASAPSASSRTARSTSWSPPTSPRAAWTWSASATSSTTTCRTTPKATRTASAARAAPAAAARRSCSSRRANARC